MPEPQWHPCDCSACYCDQAVKGNDICPACRDEYHVIEDDKSGPDPVPPAA